jgi:hypothetical protein
MRFHIVFMSVLLIGVIIAAGCVGSSAPVSGATAPIAKILENPAEYQGKSVQVSGKIVTECGSGCWFILSDGSGSIYVDLLAHNFAIPQLPGSMVTVEGRIVVQDGEPTLSATRVTAGSRTYP